MSVLQEVLEFTVVLQLGQQFICSLLIFKMPVKIRRISLSHYFKLRRNWTVLTSLPPSGVLNFSQPFLDGVNFLLDLIRVCVAVVNEAPSSFHHASYLLLAGLSGREEIFVLLDGLLRSLQTGGHLRVGQHVLLRTQRKGC